MPVGRHRCDACGAESEIRPEDFLAALDVLLPCYSDETIRDLTNAASDIGESWYRTEAMAQLLAFRGVDLGPPTEWELLSFISNGIYRDYTRRRHGR
jgi:hypothetical protein